MRGTTASTTKQSRTASEARPTIGIRVPRIWRSVISGWPPPWPTKAGNRDSLFTYGPQSRQRCLLLGLANLRSIWYLSSRLGLYQVYLALVPGLGLEIQPDLLVRILLSCSVAVQMDGAADALGGFAASPICKKKWLSVSSYLRSVSGADLDGQALS